MSAFLTDHWLVVVLVLFAVLARALPVRFYVSMLGRVRKSQRAQLLSDVDGILNYGRAAR